MKVLCGDSGVSAGISISIHVWLPAMLACPVSSPGRKREWNLGLALPGAPQASHQHMVVVRPEPSNNQHSLTPLSPLPSQTPDQGKERVVKFSKTRPPLAPGHWVVTSGQTHGPSTGEINTRGISEQLIYNNQNLQSWLSALSVISLMRCSQFKILPTHYTQSAQSWKLISANCPSWKKSSA